MRFHLKICQNARSASPRGAPTPARHRGRPLRRPIPCLNEKLQRHKLETANRPSTARAAGWNGDFKQRPRVFSLSERDELRFGLVWAQPKIEETPELAFVISPIDLPWLGEPDATLD
ncbi:hypothetical protein BHUM_03914c [Candidatus Burkholderia humilis]|nr:hypothetical protein BHUM_03914c [Candidatus Burkholderia humilis]